jgi:hypothetical protein
VERNPSKSRMFTRQTVNICNYGSRNIARLKTYADVVTEYEFHPESKCADALGNPCDRQTIGLLQRRHVKIDQIKCIGKESNSLENVEEGMVHSEQSVYTDPNGANGLPRFSQRSKNCPCMHL